ncbi:hypothetical protein PHPALM_28061 [Phytophthora palmivora]|uniref:HAT C-terminal dimerisation domain-containing protein n=1 Tax=Phytophthora palmivora TaxID=4796 RepID=A0A2P4XB13_9STRA|nr:hypothetical protein PHPALM_28061 [Phytophthora palmivora]
MDEGAVNRNVASVKDAVLRRLRALMLTISTISAQTSAPAEMYGTPSHHEIPQQLPPGFESLSSFIEFPSLQPAQVFSEELMEFAEEEAEHVEQRNVHEASIDQELKRWFSDSSRLLTTTAKTESILHFWKRQQDENNYRLLPIAARVIYAIPASSAQTERDFGISGMLVTSHRTSIAKHNIDMCSVLNRNRKFVNVVNCPRLTDSELEQAVPANVRVPNRLRYIYKDFSKHYKPHHWPRVHDQHTTGRGTNDARGVLTSENSLICLAPEVNTHSNSLSSQCSVGSAPSVTYPTQPRLCCPRLAISLGIISGATATESTSNPTMSSLQSGNPLEPPRPPHLHQTPRPCHLGGYGLGFFFLLRRYEYLAVDGKISAFAIRCRDVSFTDKNGAPFRKQSIRNIRLRIRGSKTDQLRESVSRTLHHSGSKWLCPIQAHVSIQLKAAATKAGYDGSNYGTHSLQSGEATASSREATAKLP